jgi:hypothetical protein
MNDIPSLQVVQHTLHRWWLIACLMLIGGIAGWAVTLILRPVYEATTYYKVSLDETEILRRQGLDSTDVLTFDSKNLYLAPAADLFYATDLQSDLAAALKVQGIQFDLQQFNTRAFILDRRGSVWFITIRNTDPQLAAQLANLWLEVVDKKLHNLQNHTTLAQELELQRLTVAKCFTEFDFTNANQCAGTDFVTPEDFQKYLNGLDSKISSENNAGRDIDTVLSFEIQGPAEISDAPIMYRRSLLIMAGSLIGFLLAIAAINIIPTHTSPAGEK